MNNHYSIYRILLCGGVLAFAMSPVYADPACDAEIAEIQAVLDTPPAGISQDNLGQAAQLFKVLKEDCNGGTTFDVITSVAKQVRSLLGMREAS